MSCTSFHFHPLKALPSPSPPKCRPASSITCVYKLLCSSNPKQQASCPSVKLMSRVSRIRHGYSLKNGRVELHDLRKILICLCQQTNSGSNISLKPSNGIKSNLAIQLGLLATTVAEPALAVTGVNHQEDLIWVLLKVGVIGFGYFLIMPPIIMNWLRIRWYRRNLLEMYVQFMFVFIFFPGILVWAPFLNFRKFPRDPSLKYPWSKPENPLEVKGGFLKYPWASIEDYE